MQISEGTVVAVKWLHTPTTHWASHVRALDAPEQQLLTAVMHLVMTISTLSCFLDVNVISSGYTSGSTSVRRDAKRGGPPKWFGPRIHTYRLAPMYTQTPYCVWVRWMVRPVDFVKCFIHGTKAHPEWLTPCRFFEQHSFTGLSVASPSFCCCWSRLRRLLRRLLGSRFWTDRKLEGGSPFPSTSLRVPCAAAMSRCCYFSCRLSPTSLAAYLRPLGAVLRLRFSQLKKAFHVTSPWFLL